VPCEDLQNLKVYKNKERKGQLERLVDEHTIIAKVCDGLGSFFLGLFGADFVAVGTLQETNRPTTFPGIEGGAKLEWYTPPLLRKITRH